MSLGLLFRRFLSKPLFIEDLEVKIVALPWDTSPAILLREELLPGYRVANRDILVKFTRKYKPASWMPVHCVNSETITGIFGTIVQVFETCGTSVQQTNVSMIRGLAAGTLILYVENKVKL